jgi:hypothetical protein
MMMSGVYARVGRVPLLSFLYIKQVNKCPVEVRTNCINTSEWLRKHICPVSVGEGEPMSPPVSKSSDMQEGAAPCLLNKRECYEWKNYFNDTLGKGKAHSCFNQAIYEYSNNEKEIARK